ncbi:TetR family transcriptional regulator [Pontibacillus halophilus JSM 076056 = DSM 19796]|uniref:TetR family transcriptional regulator n=1 Tax=Pontibacillus halophilus JSM 076056 = DSM 19796 TaxID=1385510 RepID=A0A0A5GQH8_9BACI|nr:TetR/AcrR family transcriptional regulator [Pontibacillus halophilus]KGX93425.1 TetR family transcriptional regulator [Pontibacillus halophilus JSM 076056 = DSM 19796]
MKKNRPKYKQIIDAAVEVIAENGYHASQVSKIAKKAGVADGTIYLYFKNKEDILVSLFQEKMGQFVETIEQEIETHSNASDMLLTLIQVHYHQLAKDHQLAVVTQLELRQSNKELRLKINDVLKGYLMVIDKIVEKGMNDGSFNEHMDRRLVRQMVFGTLDETVTNWVMNDQKYSLEEQATAVHGLITQGLTK